MKERLMTDLKGAMKSTDENKTVRLASVKAVRQAVLSYEKEKGTEITEDVFVTLVDKLIKDREKSVKAYTEANRMDLADVEKMEIDFIKVYLPERVSVEEIKEAALVLKDELGADSMKFMGQMMGKLKGQFGTSATPADISSVVKEILS